MADERPLVHQYDCTLDVAAERPMSDDEYAQWQTDQKAAAARPAEAPPADPVAEVVDILAGATDATSGFAALQAWAKTQKAAG